MGHFGFKILYAIINGERRDALAERVYAPWVDMEVELPKPGLPLTRFLESGRPLFPGSLEKKHLVGFTLQYELKLYQCHQHA